jgi:hypothetical protein
MIVDQHQPVVEKYYGRGKMRSVVNRLLEECDRVTNTLKDGWEEDRSMQRKVGVFISLYNEIMKYLLYLPLKLADITSNPPIPMFQSNPRKLQASSEELTIDPREIDKVLSELAGMVGRWHLFKKFLSEDLKVPNNLLPP